MISKGSLPRPDVENESSASRAGKIFNSFDSSYLNENQTREVKKLIKNYESVFKFEELVPGKKRFRLCLDLRKLNSYIVPS